MAERYYPESSVNEMLNDYENDGIVGCPQDYPHIELPESNWHTGTPTEFGWYVYEASSGGCYFTYIVDDEASLYFLGNTNFVRRWRKIEETD